MTEQNPLLGESEQQRTNMDMDRRLRALERGGFAIPRERRNVVRNGDFRIWQRGFGPFTTSSVYTVDGWLVDAIGSTYSLTAQGFVNGDNDPPTTSSPFFMRCAATGVAGVGNTVVLSHSIEGVRTLQDETVTVSFWARATSGTPKIAFSIDQHFGTGGAPSASVLGAGQAVTLSDIWTRYSLQFSVPSIAGKTIGNGGNDKLSLVCWATAGVNFEPRSGGVGLQSPTFDLWGIQLEEGVTASPFEDLGIDGQLAWCQRYYQVLGGAFGIFMGANSMRLAAHLPVTMRWTPTIALTTSTPYGELLGSIPYNGAGSVASLAQVSAHYIDFTVSNIGSGRTYGQPAMLGPGQVVLSAEL